MSTSVRGQDGPRLLPRAIFFEHPLHHLNVTRRHRRLELLDKPRGVRRHFDELPFPRLHGSQRLGGVPDAVGGILDRLSLSGRRLRPRAAARSSLAESSLVPRERPRGDPRGGHGLRDHRRRVGRIRRKEHRVPLLGDLAKLS